jgi:hypothetical protein
MNDVRWRNMNDDETWELLNANPRAELLIETEITMRIDAAEYVEDSYKHGPWLSTALEKVKRIAFI